MLMCDCGCMSQIKGTFHRTYTDAVLNYNAEDEASRAVDNLQHRVSPDVGSSHVTQLINTLLRCIFKGWSVATHANKSQ